MILFFIFMFALTSFGTSTIIIKPTNIQGLDVGVIFIQGAEIDAKNYILFANQLQEKFNGNLWLALTQFPLNTPEPVLIEKTIYESLSDLKNAGLKVNSETPFFFIGHSLGGTIIQDYLFTIITKNSFPLKISGIILEGCFIQRKHLNQADNPSTPPILSLSGSLDGLNRISRMAESRYFEIKKAENLSLFKRVTLIVDGMNHYQFAGEGNPPIIVRLNDIKPLITDQDARNQTTSIINSFMSISLNITSEKDKSILNNYYMTTSKLLDPIIEAFEMEGSYHFIQPCSLNETNGNCTSGSKWTELYSQKIMGSENASLIDTDVYHPVPQTISEKFNEIFPKIFNSCANQSSSCILNVTSVSQLEYSAEDSLDISLFPVAASEIRTKLSSRQAILHAYTGLNYDFKVTDDGDRCAEINNQSIYWAISKTPKEILSLYLKSGKQLTVGADIGPYDGVFWLLYPLVK